MLKQEESRLYVEGSGINIVLEGELSLLSEWIGCFFLMEIQQSSLLANLNDKYVKHRKADAFKLEANAGSSEEFLDLFVPAKKPARALFTLLRAFLSGARDRI